MSASTWLVVVAVLATAYWVVDLAALRAGLPHPLDDIWEDGVVARHLLAGEGFRTTVIYPPVWALRDPARLTVPVLVHGPLLPLALVLPLHLVGPGLLDQLAWAAALLAWLAAIQVFRLAMRWFESPTAAVVAAGLFTLSPLMLDAVHHSLSVVVGCNLLLLAFDLLTRQSPRALAAGLVLGVGYLVRPEMLLAAPILMVFAAVTHPAAAVRVAAGFAAAAAGWWWHQWRASGLPMFNLSSYSLLASFGAWPEHSILRNFDLTPDGWPATLRAALPDLWHKWIALFPRALRHVLFAPGATTGWLAMLGVVVWLRAPQRRGLAIATVLVGAIPALMMTLALPVPLYLVPFLGLYALAAAYGATWLVGRWDPVGAAPRRGLAALALLAALPAVPALLRARSEGRLTTRLLASERGALAAVDPGAGGPMFSDRPDFVAWTTGRPTIYVTRAEYDRLYPASGPTQGARPHGLPSKRDARDTWFHRGHWAVGEPVP